MIKPRAILVLVIFTLVLLWWQAQQPTWNNHMQVDIWVMWERLSYWYSHGHSFAGLRGNEILPATLMYLFVPVALSPTGSVNYGNYLPMMMLINLLVIGGHWFLVKNKSIFLTTLLFLGPILIFRFDALVTLFMLLSFYAFNKKRYSQSGFWLGIATGMKVFPVIFLPYLVMILFTEHKLKEIARLLIFFAEALIIPVFIFFLLGGNYEQIVIALSFHGQKLISIESLPGSLITGWSLLSKGFPPVMIPGNGIWAVAGPAAFLNRFWILPVAICYLVIWRKRGLINKFHYIVPYALMLIFSVFSKNLNPQYLWWFMVLLPFVNPSPLAWIVTLVVALLNQMVFPLYYTIFTENFFKHNQSYWIYYLLLARNTGIVMLCYLSVKQLLANNKVNE
jgi:hypothetical protein